MTVPRAAVDSSNVASVGYDPATLELHVEFNNGGLYVYSDVSPDEHQALLAAPSIGAFLHANIKPGRPYRKA